jgi:hypothetical protein
MFGERRPGTICNAPSMSVLAVFHGHLCERKLNRKNCNLVVIPGGMTSQLQPLYVWLISHLMNI